MKFQENTKKSRKGKKYGKKSSSEHHMKIQGEHEEITKRKK